MLDVIRLGCCPTKQRGCLLRERRIPLRYREHHASGLRQRHHVHRPDRVERRAAVRVRQDEDDARLEAGRRTAALERRDPGPPRQRSRLDVANLPVSAVTEWLAFAGIIQYQKKLTIFRDFKFAEFWHGELNKELGLPAS